jgi:hypothetical protein
MKLIGDSSVIQINILRFSNPSSLNVWDRKWLNAEINIIVHGFTAHFHTQLLIDDFTAFSNSLKNALETQKGEIIFSTLEESVFLKGLITYSGSIEWEGFAMYPVGNGNMLTFKTNSDFNQLEYMLSGINNELNMVNSIHDIG